MESNIDLLVFAAHPDDAELACGGTILTEINNGKSVVIVDLTGGELGTRGDKETRKKESEKASQILGLKNRENLGLPDGLFTADFKFSVDLIVEVIRKYKPKVILANAPSDRHPDHKRGSELVKEAVFFAALPKYLTKQNNFNHHRVGALYYYIQDRYLKPDFIVDITAVYSKKIEAIMAYQTQFYNPNFEGIKTPISGSDFIKFLEGRARNMGREANFELGEGFIAERNIGVSSLFDLK